ncbi:PREDICTED: DNA dC-_dU-editing enzyme APOBEC-3C-like [Elephantulus edwardii]|uniref:DNA dC->dU-editing enzyme APOBEC-3C-like n=1 Tax=Elephantulus edwardii TaxID=28737 RepID=UPI0003F0A025|nr:PREDICTED: DNA dC->dU-editing enzyme APOBEC-3C-like [Elephantulus edwardii]
MTYLCYRLEQLNESGPVLLKAAVLENVPGKHVEIRFRDSGSIQNLENYNQYQVTWYISWSPCAECAQEVSTFLREHPNVHLSIFTSRLYFWNEPDKQQGLRDLQKAGVHIKIMSSQDFEDCWETFVDHQGERFQPWEGIEANMDFFAGRLADILECEKEDN